MTTKGYLFCKDNNIHNLLPDPYENFIMHIFKYQIEDIVQEIVDKWIPTVKRKKLEEKRKAEAWLNSDDAQRWADELDMDLNFIKKSIKNKIN
jgi:hypothetical protein